MSDDELVRRCLRGSPDAMRMEIWRHYPVGDKVDLVERLLDRGILADATRAITRNRQPGRCCAQGCFASEAPQLVALPRGRPRDRGVPHDDAVAAAPEAPAEAPQSAD